MHSSYKCDLLQGSFLNLADNIAIQYSLLQAIMCTIQ